MKSFPAAEKIIYGLVILLCLAIFVLTMISPTTLMDVSAVYQGF